MRFLIFISSLLVLASHLVAGEIVVYNQKWTGKGLLGMAETSAGKGYLLLDLVNRKFTRISTGKTWYGPKVYWVETYPAAVFAEPSDSTNVFLVVQGTLMSTQSWESWQRTIFLKGKEVLLTLGPSQKKQVPKVVTGLRRMTQETISPHMEEESFSATFNASVTADTNGNSRTLEQQVELLTSSLKEAGYGAR